MTEPIRYASDEELSLAVAANLYDLFRAMAAVLPGSELQSRRPARQKTSSAG